MIPNVWLALRDDAQALVVERLRWNEEEDGEYQGVVSDRTARLFSYMADQETTQRLFETPVIGGRTYTLWSVYFDLPGNVLQKVQDELDALIAAYPNHIAILAAWKDDGAMVGCELVTTDVANPDYAGAPFTIPNPDFDNDPGTDEIPNPDYDPRVTIRNPAWVPEFITERSQTGTPTYPVPSYLWRFMPTEAGATDNTGLTNVNLLFGQSPRVFS